MGEDPFFKTIIMGEDPFFKTIIMGEDPFFKRRLILLPVVAAIKN